MIISYSPILKGRKDCEECKKWLEKASQYLKDGKNNVIVRMSDGRTRHIHGVGFDTEVA